MAKLDQLPGHHPARRFLSDRGFDPDLLARLYGLGFCGGESHPSAAGRIIIPYLEKDRLVGWQGLRMSGSAHSRRYLSAPGMEHSRLIYNLDRARRWRTGVVVADPMWVWALGPMGVCLPGEGASEHQAVQLAKAFRMRNLVLFLPNTLLTTVGGWRLIVALRMRLGGQLAVVPTPDDLNGRRDERGRMRHIIRESAAKSGITAVYEKAVGREAPARD